MQGMEGRGWWMAWVLLMADSARCNADVLISEFMALNSNTLTDQDGQYSDWIELYNSGTDTVNLNGGYLTDNATNLTNLRFPSTDLFPGSYRAVFTSNEKRAVAGVERHTA